MSQRSRNAADGEFVDNLYRKLLSREPDPDGRAAILEMLRKGEDRLDILDMFFRSEEFDGIRLAIAFARPGHFYSPHPGRREIDAHNQFNWERGPLPGIDYREAAQLALLEAMAKHYPALPYAGKPGPNTRYGYDNPLYSYGDGVMLFTMIQHLKPRRIIEVGSGHSSCAILDAIERLPGGGTQVTFVEPHAALLKSLVRPGDLDRHRLLEHGLQACPLSLFESLQAGDILFIDSSHVSKLGSDVNYFMFEILPVLKPGVFVHIHDIIHPFEYPIQWYGEGRAWNETYLLRAFLSFNDSWRMELFTSFMLRRHRAWFETHMPLVLRQGGGQIWISRMR
jgi:predicted O-methyltransferase YrrM